MENLSWNIKSKYIHQLAEKGERQDKRDMYKYREIDIEPNYIDSALGSARVKIGETDIVAGLSFDVGDPYSDSPDKGVIITNNELGPIASPEFESGPPREVSIELSRVVDRGIRESGALDLKELCIEEREKVWLIFLDIHILDYNGNLFDASELALTTALKHGHLPKYEDEKIHHKEEGEKIPLKKLPIENTFAKIGDKIMLDPCLEEEKSLDARITFSTTEDGLCAVQKGGSGSFTQEEVMKHLEKSFDHAEELRKQIP